MSGLLALPGLRRAVLLGVALTALMYVLGADVLHCVLMGIVLFALAILFSSLGATDDPGEPDALPVPFSTPLLRSFVLLDPRSPDPVGGNAGTRAYAVWSQARADHPDDPLLTSYATSAPDRWRYLPQRDLVAILDRIDTLSTRRTQEDR